MTITPAQYEAAYHVGLDHHDGKFGIVEAKRRLEGTGLNSNTGADLIYNLSHLLNGKRYKRTLSGPATNDYLTWIRRDRGDAALGRAIEALSQHIGYYENKGRTRLNALRDVMARHQALLAHPAETVLLLTWKDQESAGFTDELPLAWFAKKGILTKLCHVVRNRRGSRYRAYCDAVVRDTVAELDYEPYPEANARDEILLGVIRLHFEDRDRCSLAKVEWKPAGSAIFMEADFDSPAFWVPPAPAYIPPTEFAAKVIRLVRERPGQAAFRRLLKSVYDNRCCISGCAVAEALEGAHIDPFVAEASNAIPNGLLLRSDLHTLFDRHLISVDPGTLQVHVAERARMEASYSHLHGASLRLPQEPTHRPHPDALKRHWKRFQGG